MAAESFEAELEVVVAPSRPLKGGAAPLEEAAPRAPGASLLVVIATFGAAFFGLALRSYGVATALFGLGITAARLLTLDGSFERPETRPTRVVASSAGVRVGAQTIPASAISRAYYQPRGDLPATVRAEGEGALLFEAEVGSREQGDALLRALGHDVARRRFRVGEAPSLSGALFIASFAFIAAIFGLAPRSGADPFLAAFAGGIVFATLLAVAVFVGGGLVDVGADGLVVVTVRGRRFVPYSAVRGVRLRDPGARARVEVELTDGERIRVGSIGAGVVHALLQRALLARIEEALAAYRRTSPPVDLVGQVARGGRSVAAWRADLSRMHEDREGYRVPAAREEHLWSILEDPSSPEDARAAAAVTLRGAAGSDGGRSADVLPRLRVAGAAIASPRLRVAVETAADPEAAELALDAALTPFADEAEAERRRAG